MKLRFRVFQSIPEVLTYLLLILMLSLNVIGLSISSNNAQQAKILAAQAKTLAAQNQSLAAASQASTRQIEKQINCISAYFNTPDRTGNTTINNLNSCDINK